MVAKFSDGEPCWFSLSKHGLSGFITSAALILGTPVPHAVYLKEKIHQYSAIDVFGDSLLNTSAHASHTRVQSHDRLAHLIAELATQHGIPSTTKHIPVATDHSDRRGDIATCRGGLVHPDARFNFGPTTLLVMDFELGHTYHANRAFKQHNLRVMERHKCAKYLSDYHAQGYAFAPLVCNSLGQLGPDFVRFLWRLADHAARNHIPPDLRALPILDPADQSHLQAFKRLRGHIYVQSTYKLLAAIFEGVTERIYGRTFTLKTLPRYHEIIAARSEPWLPLPSPSAAGPSDPSATSSQLSFAGALAARAPLRAAARSPPVSGLAGRARPA